MEYNKLVFAQLTDYLPHKIFYTCVEKYDRSRNKLKFSYYDQFICMAFAQLTFRESLRDIEACLRSFKSKLYHLGIRGNIARSTLADANEKRDYRIYQDFAIHLIAEARKLYVGEKFSVDLEATAYALDTTTIDLCLSIFPWAKFRSTKAAVKLHTLLDLRGNIPSFIHITDGKVHEVNILDILPVEAGSFYVMDRGFLDFKRLYNLNNASAFFVTRTKSNTKYQIITSRSIKKSNGILADQRIILSCSKAAKEYPAPLRAITF
jgi:hypothetical protein